MTMIKSSTVFPCVHVNLAALRHNVQRLRQLAAGSRLMAVVKANAYGHGMVPVAQALAAYCRMNEDDGRTDQRGAGFSACDSVSGDGGANDRFYDSKAASLADGFAVARLEEALRLREAGICQPIVLLEGFFSAAQLPLIALQHLQIVVHSTEQLVALEQAHLPAPLTVWLKLDSGMHRLGFHPEQASAVYARLAACASVRQPVHFMSHFARADEADSSYSEQQIASFYHCVNICLPHARVNNTENSTANNTENNTENSTENDRPQCSLAASAGILRYPQAHADWIRPGILLYGVSPLTDNACAADFGFRPVMTLSSQLIAVRAHPANASVGYGGRWHSSQATRLGVIALGYGDGYPQAAPCGTPVLVNGRRVPMVGRVSMDMICVDLGANSTDKAGDPVVFWGPGLPVECIARAVSASPYELMTRLTSRLNYQYDDQE